MIRLSQILDTFGSGGSNLPPGQGVTNLRDVLRVLLGAIGGAVANVAALEAVGPADRQDGMQVVALDTYTVFVWQVGNTTSPDATHVRPNDISGGNPGRWVSAGEGSTGATGPTGASAAIVTGTSTLSTGVSPSISCPNLSASSRVFVNRTALNASTALGLLSSLSADRVTGASGNFLIKSEKTDASGVQTADFSSVEWLVIL